MLRYSGYAEVSVSTTRVFSDYLPLIPMGNGLLNPTGSKACGNRISSVKQSNRVTLTSEEKNEAVWCHVPFLPFFFLLYVKILKHFTGPVLFR